MLAGAAAAAGTVPSGPLRTSCTACRSALATARRPLSRSATSSWNRRSQVAVTTAGEKRWAAARAAAPIRPRSSVSLMSSIRAEARASVSPGGTRMPVCPSMTTSRGPLGES
ncbi:hypothetical protein SALBM217S_03899 [Streptomyces griseoloalbus]